MADFVNVNCPVCNEKFAAEDDIVVCPVCGTPHHRGCYAKLGRCANEQWHTEGKIFNADEQRGEEKTEQTERAEDVVCRRCGERCNSNAIFCSRCGAPVMHNKSGEQGAQGPFFAMAPIAVYDENEELEGVEAYKIASLVKENKIRFMLYFKAMIKKKSKTSFNFAAFLFSPFYFIYRKMYGIGIAALLLFALLNVPSIIMLFTNEYLSEIVGSTVSFGLSLSKQQINFLLTANYISSLIITAVRFLSGFFANWLYFKKLKKQAVEISINTKTKDEFIAVADKKGGVNRIAIGVIVAVVIFFGWAAAFALVSPNILGF